MSKKIRVAILSISLLALAACGGGGSGGSDNAGSPDPVIPDPSNNDVKVNSQSDAAKFLNRATFGPTQDSINQLVNRSTYQNWINDQFNTHLSPAPSSKLRDKNVCKPQ